MSDLASRNIKAGETMRNRPELWSGPGILFSCSTMEGAQGPGDTQGIYTRIEGPFARLASWEGRWSQPLMEEGGQAISEIGDPALLTRFHNESIDQFSFELDISWNNAAEEQRAHVFCAAVLPPVLSALIAGLPDLDPNAVNENRSISVPDEFAHLGVTVIDLPINTLPSSRRRSRPLVVGSRWVRLIVTNYGLISFWYPVHGNNWPEEAVPWPHNAIPSRDKEFLDLLQTQALTPQQRLEAWIDTTLQHEHYYMQAWQTEIDFWREAAFRWLTDNLSHDEVTILRKDLGNLTTYLSAVRWTQRALEKRARESSFHGPFVECKNKLGASSLSLQRDLESARQTLAESFTILSTVSQRMQEDATEAARESSEKLNWLITLFTTILFVPTIVAGIYGANIDYLSPGSQGNLRELLVLMAGFALVSFGILNFVTGKRWTGILAVSTGIAGMVVDYMSFLPGHSYPIPMLSIAVFILFAAFVMVSTRERRAADA